MMPAPSRLLPYAILLLQLLVPAAARGDWTLQSSAGVQDRRFFGISAFDGQHAMAVGTRDSMGSAEAVVATTSDGSSWTQKTPDSGNPFAFYAAVHMVSATKAFVGGIGKLFSTTNGGSSWTTYTENGWGLTTGPGIAGIEFAGSEVGFLVGSGGFMRKTTDGGATWTPLTSPVSVDLWGVRAVDANRVWVWSGAATAADGGVTGYEDGALLRSTDGGATWSVVFQNEPRQVAKVFMLNANDGWMVSNAMSGPRLERTQDGGATWTAMPVPAGAGGAPDTVLDVFFVSPCEGFLLQEQQEQTQLMYTVDRGATWTTQDLSGLAVPLPFAITLTARLMAFDFPSRQVGFAGGNFESLSRYDADGAAPACAAPDGDDTAAGEDAADTGDSGGGGCGCRAASPAAGGVPTLLALGLLVVLRRRPRG